MALREILEAAAADICVELGREDGVEYVAFNHDARTFARVLYIAKRAEAMACAEDRVDELRVQTECLRELEGKAPLTVAAIQESLTGGNYLVKERLRQLEVDRAKITAATRELKSYEANLTSRSLALTSGSNEVGSRLALVSQNVVQGELEGDDEQDEGERLDLPEPPAMDLPRDPEEDADAEIERENEGRKEDPRLSRF